MNHRNKAINLLNKLYNRRKLLQFSKFLATGAFNNMMAFLLFAVLLMVMHYLYAAILTSVIGNVVGFFLHRNIVFTSGEGGIAAFVKFITFTVALLGLHLAILTFLVEYIGIIPLIGGGVSLLCLIPIGFLGYKVLVFKEGCT